MSTVHCLLLRYVGTAILTCCGSAFAGEWVTVASGCQPDPDSHGNYVFTDAAFAFAPGATGLVIVRCNLSNPSDVNANPPWNRMEVTYSDPNGSTGGAAVHVYLYRVERSTGQLSRYLWFSSNTRSTAGQQCVTESFSDAAFDFDRFGYHLEIHLVRSDPALEVKAQRVRLYWKVGAGGLPGPGGGEIGQ
jgi:hypothetical protein